MPIWNCANRPDVAKTVQLLPDKRGDADDDLVDSGPIRLSLFAEGRRREGKWPQETRRRTNPPAQWISGKKPQFLRTACSFSWNCFTACSISTRPGGSNSSAFGAQTIFGRFSTRRLITSRSIISPRLMTTARVSNEPRRSPIAAARCEKNSRARQAMPPRVLSRIATSPARRASSTLRAIHPTPAARDGSIGFPR